MNANMLMSVPLPATHSHSVETTDLQDGTLPSPIHIYEKLLTISVKDEETVTESSAENQTQDK